MVDLAEIVDGKLVLLDNSFLAVDHGPNHKYIKESWLTTETKEIDNTRRLVHQLTQLSLDGHRITTVPEGLEEMNQYVVALEGIRTAIENRLGKGIEYYKHQYLQEDTDKLVEKVFNNGPPRVNQGDRFYRRLWGLTLRHHLLRKLKTTRNNRHDRETRGASNKNAHIVASAMYLCNRSEVAILTLDWDIPSIGMSNMRAMERINRNDQEKIVLPEHPLTIYGPKFPNGSNSLGTFYMRINFRNSEPFEFISKPDNWK